MLGTFFIPACAWHPLQPAVLQLAGNRVTGAASAQAQQSAQDQPNRSDHVVREKCSHP
jgi:hypothetical protein